MTTTTVITVDGFLFKGFIPDLNIVKHYVSLGAVVHQLSYDNTDATTANIIHAANMAYDLAVAAPGPVVFVGASMGSQVLCNLLRTNPSASLPWTFILCANPEHKYTGRIKSPQYGGGLGIPSNTPFNVTDLACQYDYYADVPNGPIFSAMCANAFVTIVGGGIHTFGYFALDPALPYPHTQEGNIRYMWAPSTLTTRGLGIVEYGYRRPVSLH